MLEADVDDGNFNVLTQAITSALRAQPVTRALPASSSGERTLQLREGAAVGEAAEPQVEAAASVEESSVTPEPRREPAKPREPYRPKVNVIEVDLDSGPVSFERFARERNPTGIQERFLTAAAWYKDHRKLDSVSLDHVYTCFRKMGWPPVEDMSDPCRKLVKRGCGTYNRKVFSINHIGVAEVAKLAGETVNA
jgi:hypothetical protein